MTRTDFSNAFLYGVEFSGSTTIINGVDFSNAILVGASFDQAMFVVDPQQGGAEPKFPGAFLQGTNLGSAVFDSTSLLNAYLDFQPDGNQMQVLLGPSYTGFAGWEAPNQPVCVQLDYTHFVTQVPLTTGNTTCPDGLQHGGGCGPTPHDRKHVLEQLAPDRPGISPGTTSTTRPTRMQTSPEPATWVRATATGDGSSGRAG
jgi:hypothetical protein